MNFNDIDYLAAVAEHRHLGRAADALGLTQPALSRAMSRLEALAGQPLFERHPKGMAPTAACEAFLQRMLALRAGYDDALAELAQLRTGNVGALRVGYGQAVDTLAVFEATRRLAVERPAVRLTLVSRLLEELLDRLRTGKLDLAVAQVSETVPEGCVASPLYRDRLQVVADQDHPLAKRRSVALADIAGQDWVLQAKQFRQRRMLDELFAQVGLPQARIRIETDLESASRLRLLLGTGLLGVYSDRSADSLRGVGLCALPVAGLRLTRQIAILRRAGAYVSPLSERFVQLLRAQTR